MANELFNVAGKVVVMTGGAGVLGKGISKYLAAQGAKMVVLDRSEEAGKALVDEIVAQGHEATFLYTDVMNKEVLEQNKKDILEKYGRIDVLLNAAVTCCIYKAEKYIFLLSQNQKCIRSYRSGDSRENPSCGRDYRCTCKSNFRKPYRSLRSKDKDCKSFRGYL